METREVKTSTGYVATIRTTLKYGEYKAIQRVLVSSMNFDVTGKSTDMNASMLYDANDKAIEFILISIKDSNGTELVEDHSKVRQVVDSLDIDTGEEIMQAVGQVWLSNKVDKKRGI